MQEDEEQIFHIARRIVDCVARTSYLDVACSQSTELRSRIETLLSSHENDADHFLRPIQPTPPDGTQDHSAAMFSGRKIDQYTLLEEIGEGAFGVVWAAQQDAPTVRTVALKVIKPGMDSKQIVARFNGERHALSIMNHPNVATVLDAGMTDIGQSYFVMEHVRGSPISEYCDTNQLTILDRIQLLIQVCEAVQHAHQKGIIHRDLKPSNILVATSQHGPIVKVIDFGIAKAVSQPISARSFQTAPGQIVGTLEYMSPEQAQSNAIDVDTRSDVYSLGVVLFELLVGSTPVHTERFRNASYAEVQRLIVEQDVPKPSSRLNEMGNSIVAVANRRNTTATSLVNEIRGELEWIVLKALEKERSRRYDSPVGLSSDLGRFLVGDLVLASPPSRMYRVRKALRRNKSTFASLTVVALILIAATVVSLSMATIARQERNRTAAREKALQRVLDDLHVELVEKIQTRVMAGDEAAAKAALAQAELAGVPEEKLQLYRGQLAFYFDRPAESHEILAPLSQNSIAAHALLALAKMDSGDLAGFDESVQSLTERVSTTSSLSVEDRLMAAQAILEHDPAFAKTLLDGVLEERDSPFARLVHALAFASYAQETGDEDAIRQALEDIGIAVSFARGSPLCLAAYLDIKHIAFSLDVTIQHDFTEETLRGYSERFAEFPIGRGVLVRYLASVNSERAVELINSWTEASIAFNEFEWVYYVPILLAHESPAKVLKRMESITSPTPFVNCTKARIMSLIPAYKNTASELCHSTIRDTPASAVRSACLWTLLTLGEREHVRSLSAELLETSTTPTFYSAESMKLWGSLTTCETFLSDAQHTRSNQCLAHFSLAGQSFADSQWTATVEHFKKCCQTQMFLQYEYWWAWSLRIAIEQQPEWIKQSHLAGLLATE